MPLIGFCCPKNTDTEGENVKFEECLTKECENCVPYPIRNALISSIGERTTWVSPSTIIGCLRKAKWEHTREYYLPPMESYHFMRGNLIHEILYRSASPDAIVEQAVSREVYGTGVVLQGRIDRYKNGVLYDYKTMADLGFKFFQRDPVPKERHVMQANIYRWLMVPNYEVKDIKIIYIGMNNVAVTGEALFINKWGKETVYDLNPCPIHSDQRVYEYIKDKIELIERSDNPPADTSETWLCDICQFKDECRETGLSDRDVDEELPF